jgi:hypothetical protein
MMDWLTPQAIEFELSILNMALGFFGGATGWKGVKFLILKFWPQAAPILNALNSEQKELSKVIDAAKDKNEDLKDWALKKGLKVAAHLIKK